MRNILKVVSIAALAAACNPAEADESKTNICIDNTRSAIQQVEQNPYGSACERIEDSKEGVFRLTSALEIEPVATPVKPRPKKAVVPKKVEIAPEKEPELKIAPLPPPPPPILPEVSKEAEKKPEQPLTLSEKWHQSIFKALDYNARVHTNSAEIWLDGLKDLIENAQKAGISIDRVALSDEVNKLILNKNLPYMARVHTSSAEIWLDGLRGLAEDAREIGIELDMKAITQKVKELIASKHLPYMARVHPNLNMWKDGGLDRLIEDARELGLRIEMSEVETSK